MTGAAIKHGVQCDLVQQDNLFLGNGRGGWKAVEEKAEARRALGYPYETYSRRDVSAVLGSQGYEGAIRYSGTFGINPLLYSQRVKQVLLENGVRVYESSEVTSVDGHTARTHLGSVTAD